jgi:long-subunit fatty acid transport protein
MRNSNTVKVLALVAGAVLPSTAWAYGVEIPENGASAFGRGGAFMVRSSDPSAVMHNVAAIVGLPGLQLTLSSNVGAFEHCFQRTGNGGNYEGTGSPAGATIDPTGTVFETMPGSGDARYINGRTRYPEVCKEPSVSLAPMLLGTYRINRYVGIGFGIFAPSTQGSAQNFPDRVMASDGTGSFLAPSPARNLLYRKSLLVLHPVVAVSVQPTRWLRVGLSLQPSIGRFQFGLNANAVRSQAQSPSSDVLIELDATGFFMAGSAAVQVLPTRFISFGAQFQYNGPIDASGTANNRANLYAANPANVISSSFTINSMQVQLPWTLRGGVRYNLPRAGRPTQDDGTGTYDPMTDDVFDIEAMFTYEGTSSLSRTSLVNSGGIRIDNAGTTVNAPPTITIESALTDVVGFRLGGDWNVIPGTLAVRAGMSYETAGVSPNLAQIHLPAYAGASVHAGLSYRWRWLTIAAGFGHFFFDGNNASSANRNVTVPGTTQIPINTPGMAATCPESGSGQGAEACTINRGTYRASFTAGSLQFIFRL